MVPVDLRGGHEGTTEDDVIHWGKSMLKADANPKRFEKKWQFPKKRICDIELSLPALAGKIDRHV